MKTGADGVDIRPISIPARIKLLQGVRVLQTFLHDIAGHGPARLLGKEAYNSGASITFFLEDGGDNRQ